MQTSSETVVLVAGATRGAGRGIARAFGERGATVICTGRSSRERGTSPSGRPETIEETADLVDRAGGSGVPVVVDHTVEAEVKDLVERIRSDHGRLDVIVNDIWGGDGLTEWGKGFWELDLGKGFTMMERALHTHIITSRHGVPLLLEGDGGLVVEVTDGAFQGYRGQLFYDLCKATAMRLAYGMSVDLRGTDVTALAVTPGFLRSEAVLDHFGVSEERWRDAVARDEHFALSESPLLIGRVIAALAADPDVGRFAGRTLAGWDLAREYGVEDIDGRQPHWDEHLDAWVDRVMDEGSPTDTDLAVLQARMSQLDFDRSRADQRARLEAFLTQAGTAIRISNGSSAPKDAS